MLCIMIDGQFLYVSSFFLSILFKIWWINFNLSLFLSFDSLLICCVFLFWDGCMNLTWARFTEETSTMQISLGLSLGLSSSSCSFSVCLVLVLVLFVMVFKCWSISSFCLRLASSVYVWLHSKNGSQAFVYVWLLVSRLYDRVFYVPCSVSSVSVFMLSSVSCYVSVCEQVVKEWSIGSILVMEMKNLAMDHLNVWIS